MVKLLIIADDLTGTLDTGIQFSERGIATKVQIGAEYTNNQEECQVLVIDSETRHLDASEAYKIVNKIATQAIKAGVPYIFKKTDSALRGNIGAELEALYQAGKETLAFIPAFPKMNRATQNGIHLIDGLPVSQSVFGIDPFDPVTKDSVKEIINQQSKLKVKEVFNLSGYKVKENQQILSFDATTQEDIIAIASKLQAENQLKLMAGCAGFASILPDLLGLDGGSNKDYKKTDGLLVVCGSVNPITKSQLDYASEQGFTRIRLTHEQKLNKAYWYSEEGEKTICELYEQIKNLPNVIIDTNDIEGLLKTMDYAKETYGMSLDEARVFISENLGYVLRRLVEMGLNHSLMVTGGDTLLGFVEEMNVTQLDMICEIESGTVLSEFEYAGKTFNLLSKSGGFGEVELLLNLENKLRGDLVYANE